MNFEYYGAKADVEAEINGLLKIFATGKEQDWEIEFADPEKIEEMLAILLSNELSVDSCCALALLTISSFDLASQAGDVDDMLIGRFSKFLNENNEVKQKMFFYWVFLKKSENTNLMQRIFTAARQTMGSRP